VPREETYADGSTRLQTLLGRIMAMPDGDVDDTLGALERCSTTGTAISTPCSSATSAIVAPHLSGSMRRCDPELPTGARRELIGAYFTHEYSIEAAALGNPSIVVGPDQSGLAPGEVRFVMSLRAIGEGHVSSIEFRTGVVAPTPRCVSTRRAVRDDGRAATPRTRPDCSRPSSATWA
jgi:hypothetical protein